MCAIVGGTRLTQKELTLLHVSRTRGRDYSNIFMKGQSWICNHRAIPTTEKSNPEHNQPFGTDYKIVHNGTIANDKELGVGSGEIDSSVLPKVLDCTNIDTLHQTIQKVKGSYAIAIMKPNGTFYLLCNYQPIAYAYDRDEYGLKRLVAFTSYVDDLKYCQYSNIERLPPYSILDTETWNTRDIPRTDYHNALVICSGGLDSTAVAAYACYVHKPENVTLIHYRYGCIAETKEIQCIKKIAEYLKCNLDFIDVNMSFMNKNSALFKTENDIHKGIEGSEYAYEWVPARNLIMLSLAVGYAEANRITNIYLGTNLEESGAYPDNCNQFIKDFDACLYGAVQNGVKVKIHTPVGNLMKHEIVAFGNKYNAPFQYTWSCYKKGDKPCGQCGPCFMRRTAFRRNGLEDPLEYPKDMKFDEVENIKKNIVNNEII